MDMDGSATLCVFFVFVSIVDMVVILIIIS